MNACGGAYRPAGFQAVLLAGLLAGLVSRKHAVALTSGQKSHPFCKHAGKLAAEIDAPAPSILPAFWQARLRAGHHFHREKLPKHCLGEKCDVKMIACASALAADARETAYRIGVGFGVLAMASASALATSSVLCCVCSA